MKKYIYILVYLISFVSCDSHNRIADTIMYDANIEKSLKTFQQRKNQFFVSDSAQALIQNIGWAQRIVSDAKIKMEDIPSVYKNIDNSHFSVELPCWEFDSPEYQTANVIVEHRRIDSAIVLAKIKGIDEIYYRSQVQVVSQLHERDEYHVDSVKYSDTYEYYVRNAYLTCLCISKRKKIFIVNATIQIHNKYHASEAETHRFYE